MKKIIYLILFLFVLGVVGYGLHWYFTKNPNIYNSAITSADQEKINNTYLDTLVVNINTQLKDIQEKVNLLDQDFKAKTLSMSVLFLVSILNLIFGFLACIFVFSLIKRKTKNNS